MLLRFAVPISLVLSNLVSQTAAEPVPVPASDASVMVEEPTAAAVVRFSTEIDRCQGSRNVAVVLLGFQAEPAVVETATKPSAPSAPSKKRRHEDDNDDDSGGGGGGGDAIEKPAPEPESDVMADILGDGTDADNTSSKPVVAGTTALGAPTGATVEPASPKPAGQQGTVGVCSAVMLLAVVRTHRFVWSTRPQQESCSSKRYMAPQKSRIIARLRFRPQPLWVSGVRCAITRRTIPSCSIYCIRIRIRR